MSTTSKKYLFLSFSLTFSLGLILLSLILPTVQAADVNVNATVAVSAACNDGTLDAGEECENGIAGGCYNNACNGDCTCPVCDNGTIEAGEDCEDDSACSEGFFCNSSCLCQQIGGGCIPGNTTCSWGECIDGTQSGFCTDGCAIWPATQSCGGPVCGDGNLDTGEECDDGNTVSDDGCSATCQVEFGCGDGVIDSGPGQGQGQGRGRGQGQGQGQGEQCDDGNTTSGDCCSSNCTQELLITSVSVGSITETTAVISWSTPCQTTNSTLDWGQTPAVGEGTSSSSGQNFGIPIGGLIPDTVYYYRITATAGPLLDIATGSFRTTSVVPVIEDCNNGLDDDGDGFCDYPSSVCIDGSTPGDSECICSPNFVCTPGPCRPSNIQTVYCVDQTVPKCESDYDYDQECEACPGVTCGPCQQLDTNTCSCVEVPNCCGNDACEPPGEDPYNCPGDCPVTCLSDWECTSWAPNLCPESGIQTRDCFDRNACQIPINRPDLTQSCSGACIGLSCGTCQEINTEQCICEELIPCCGDGICESGESYSQCPQDCIEICTPNWMILSWSECIDGTQVREVYDLNNCDLDIGRPPSVRSCTEGCDVACGVCQQIDLASCSCFETVLCCGNNICEGSETVWACPVDCGIPPGFRLELTDCLDGLDNDNDGFVDFPADPGCSQPTDNSELNFAEVIENIQKFIQEQIIDQVVEKVLDNPAVEQINETIATPVLITTVVVNTFATFSFFNFFSYLQFFITQPFAALFRRKRKKWGIIYNSLTKQPVDLAIVRLYQKENARLVQSRVTDKLGRFSFLLNPGRYYITVTKPKFTFPSEFLKDAKEDVKYLDIYHGETIEVTEKQANITVNIPIDPIVEEKPVAKLIFQHYLRKVQFLAAFSAVPLATVSMVISPGPLTYSMFSFHCLLFVLFRRLGYQKPPKNWGIIFDKKTKKPLGRAITRIYDKKYNKLLETRVTDAKGRYSFLVNNNIYYVTAERLGYKPFKTKDIDLAKEGAEAVVGMDIGLEKGKSEETPTPPAPAKPAAPTQPTTPTPPAGKTGVPSKPAPVVPTPAADKPTAEAKPAPPAPTVPPAAGAKPEAPSTPAKTPSKPVVPPQVAPTAPVPPAAEAKPEAPLTPSLKEKVEDLEVSKESLKDLLGTKKEIREIKEDIDEKQEELEKLEDKIDKIEETVEETVEEKLDKINGEVISPDKAQTTPTKPVEKIGDKKEDKKDKPPTEKSIFG